MKEPGIDKVDFAKGGGLVPVVAQDWISKKVLMLAYADREALRLTLSTGFAHYYSRSRKALWKKGETSGHVQRVREVFADCDMDSIVYMVDQTGPACHTGKESCFFNRADKGNSAIQDLSMMAKAVGLIEGGTITTRRWVRDSTRRSYKYIVNPITEAIPPPPADVIEWIAEMMDRMSPVEVDKVVTFEALGIPYSILLAQRRKLPLAIVRKRDFLAPKHLFVKVAYRSGFERGTYYVYDLAKGDRVLVIDDMVSTGGTLALTLHELFAKGVRVEGVLCVGEKPQYGGVEAVQRAGFTIKALFGITQTGGHIQAYPSDALLEALGAKGTPMGVGADDRYQALPRAPSH